MAHEALVESTTATELTLAEWFEGTADASPTSPSTCPADRCPPAAALYACRPELRSLEILELGADGRYVHALGATSGVIDPVPGCEGLVLDLDALGDEVERLAPKEDAG